MPKIVDKKKMQEKIITAAIDAFLQYGVNNTTMEMIAKKAHIAKGTLYLYFESKYDLLYEINELHFARWKESLRSNRLFETVDELLLHIKSNLLLDKKEAEFLKIFFEAFGTQLSSKNFTNKYNLFFEEISIFYKGNFEFLINNGAPIDPVVNSFTFCRALVSMMDGLILHRGFFNLTDEKYLCMVDDAFSMFKFWIMKKSSTE